MSFVIASSVSYVRTYHQAVTVKTVVKSATPATKIPHNLDRSRSPNVVGAAGGGCCWQWLLLLLLLRLRLLTRRTVRVATTATALSHDTMGYQTLPRKWVSERNNRTRKQIKTSPIKFGKAKMECQSPIPKTETHQNGIHTNTSSGWMGGCFHVRLSLSGNCCQWE